ncbi:MAG: 50S ribosomal protein L32e [archaeon]|jgi:large subunit ribosomal protein L32e|nr:50S ribosomal protein L32e [archaeon]
MTTINERKSLIKRLRKKKPVFRRQESTRYKRVPTKWKAPKGRQSKQRLGKGGSPKTPGKGYGTPKIVRGLHPSGYEDILIKNLKELEAIEPKTQAVRFSTRLGQNKINGFRETAKKLGIKVLN